MQIKITPRTLGGTEFTAQPARLHLGAQNAEGVDRLVFQLPAEWAGCNVTLHIRHAQGGKAVRGKELTTNANRFISVAAGTGT